MRNYLGAIACTLALFALLAGCSEEKKEEGKSKGIIEQASDEVAHKAAEHITKPLEKAKASQALQNAQNQNIEDMVEQTEQEN
jgi:ABC-type uncharacterized transport system auxiliary subunit